MMTTDADAAVRRFVGKYDDVDIETGVENVKERIDEDFREAGENLIQSVDYRN
ncbi:hypothetical protein [Halorussus litoreus]|uniref:hypothetical protein n=1 Tax=Halorussus litoreus TaxID=1710536 RepID=UPI0013003287|nr:hypothetical protein [Halorussus litoreus]